MWQQTVKRVNEHLLRLKIDVENNLVDIWNQYLALGTANDEDIVSLSLKHFRDPAKMAAVCLALLSSLLMMRSG